MDERELVTSARGTASGLLWFWVLRGFNQHQNHNNNNNKKQQHRAPLERLARYAADVEHLMLLDEDKLKRAVERGSKEPPIAGRHITHDPTITSFR